MISFGWERLEEWGVTVNGYKVCFGCENNNLKNVLQLIVVRVVKHCEYAQKK